MHDAAARAREVVWRRYRSWSWPILGLFILLDGGLTAMAILANFFWVFVVMSVGSYLFAIAVLRGVRDARRDVAHLTRILEGLQGEIVAARALDPKDEVPHGLGLLILDNGLAVYVEGSRIWFVRFFSEEGKPLPATMREAEAWTRGEESKDGRSILETRPPGTAIPPGLSRVAAEWSLPSVDLTFRWLRKLACVPPHDEAMRIDPGPVAGSIAFEVPDRGIPPTQLAQQRDAIRDALDEMELPRID